MPKFYWYAKNPLIHTFDAKSSLIQLMSKFHWYNWCQKFIDTIDAKIPLIQLKHGKLN
jgi:hypothetical protein